MAIKQKISTASGIEVNDAYHRVEQVTLVNKSAITFSASAYKNNEIKVRSKISIRKYNEST